MRLLKTDECGNVGVSEYLSDNFPPYAILSHTWGPDSDEVTFNDLRNGLGGSKPGYAKIRFCADRATSDHLTHFWIDSCCIDRANHTELSEAITSMFRWYRNATRCYVYLSDVSVSKGGGDQHSKAWEPAFRASRWFSRGWTLQELLAPKFVEFFSREGHYLGNKMTLQQQLHEVTGIPIAAIHGAALTSYSVEERLQWAASRSTKRKEDKAYCLLGIFEVYMPLIYGEEDHAFTRLLKKINKLPVKRQPCGSELTHIPFQNTEMNTRNAWCSSENGLFSSRALSNFAITQTQPQLKQKYENGVFSSRADFRNSAKPQWESTGLNTSTQARRSQIYTMGNLMNQGDLDRFGQFSRASARTISNFDQRSNLLLDQMAASHDLISSRHATVHNMQQNLALMQRQLLAQLDQLRSTDQSIRKIPNPDFAETEISSQWTTSAISELFKDAFRAAVLLAGGAVYADHATQEALRRLFARARVDPMLVLILVAGAFYVIRCLRQLPQQLSILSDNSILFEDPFGVKLRIPFLQCSRAEIFHGFLEAYFKERPGLNRVRRKQYFLALGKSKRRLDNHRWPEKIRPRSIVTMFMIMVTGEFICFKCQETLISSNMSEFYCPQCHQDYLIADPDSIEVSKSIEELKEEEEEDHDDAAGKDESREISQTTSMLKSSPTAFSSPTHQTSQATRRIPDLNRPDLPSPRAVKRRGMTETMKSAVDIATTWRSYGGSGYQDKEHKSFKNMALFLSGVLNSLGDAELAFARLPYLNGASFFSTNLWQSPGTYLHYHISKRKDSWNDTDRRLLDTAQVVISKIIRTQNEQDIAQHMQNMSRARRAEILRLLLTLNSQEYDERNLWYIKYLAVLKTRISKSVDGQQQRDVVAMDIIVAKQDGFRVEGETLIEDEPLKTPEILKGFDPLFKAYGVDIPEDFPDVRSLYEMFGSFIL